MSALQEAIQKILVNHAGHSVAEIAMTLPATDPSADRLIYAGFPAPLKDAMKIAAKRWDWDRETWRYQTLLIQDAMNRVLVDDLARAYRHPPPDFQEAA